MLHLDDPGINPPTAQGLGRYQAKVNAAGTFSNQLQVGKDLFKKYNRSNNPVFRAVHRKLKEMCSGAQRCNYCEDSAGDEVEHIKPRSLYPERVFVWDNYLLSCGQCNRSKGSRFSVIRQGRFIDVTHRPGSTRRKSPTGCPVIINPRTEDPLAFFQLEIAETFLFLPMNDLPEIAKKRACYTIQVLKLNRDVLLEARREAYGAYRARLSEYRTIQSHDAPQSRLDTLRDAIKTTAHPTVWREMQRQQSDIAELRELFSDIPEALFW